MAKNFDSKSVSDQAAVEPPAKRAKESVGSSSRLFASCSSTTKSNESTETERMATASQVMEHELGLFSS